MRPRANSNCAYAMILHHRPLPPPVELQDGGGSRTHQHICSSGAERILKDGARARAAVGPGGSGVDDGGGPGNR